MATSSFPPTMRALTLPPPPYTASSSFPPSALKYTTSHPAPPSPSPTHYTIHVTHTALTRSELTWPETLSPARSSAVIPGHDAVGTVVSAPTTTLPETARKFNPGDTVFALLSFAGDGAAADYALALPSELALLPRGPTTPEAAAAVPLSALSAWQALFEHAGLHPPPASPSAKPPGKPTRILVTGASGGVGAMAVQIAQLLPNAYVVGTCSARNVTLVKSLGADLVLDYTVHSTLSEGLSSTLEGEKPEPFDIILDTVGSATLEQCCAPPLIADGGKVISVAMPLSAAQISELGIQERGVSVQFFIVRPHGAQLETIARFMECGKVRGVVDSVWELEKGAEAMEVVERGRCTGKVVLRVN